MDEHDSELKHAACQKEKASVSALHIIYYAYFNISGLESGDISRLPWKYPRSSVIFNTANIDETAWPPLTRIEHGCRARWLLDVTVRGVPIPEARTSTRGHAMISLTTFPATSVRRKSRPA